MSSRHPKLLGSLLALLLVAGATGAESNLWLHVKVDEADGAKVTVNLPLAMVERAIPLLPHHHIEHARIVDGHVDLALEDLRALWQEVKDSPDMTFVTLEDGDDDIRVWKEADWVYVKIRGDGGAESVDVRMPQAVLDALLTSEKIDVESAVRALVEHGRGDFVTVRDRDDNVRVWVDDVPEAD